MSVTPTTLTQQGIQRSTEKHGAESDILDALLGIRTVVLYGTARREVKARLLLIFMLILTLIVVVGLVIGAFTL